MKSTIFELIGFVMVVAGLMAVHPALLVAAAGAVIVAFGYTTGGIE